MDPKRDAIPGPVRRRAGAAIAISLVLHLAILLAIGLAVPHPVFRTPPDLRPVNLVLLPPMLKVRPHQPTPLPQTEQSRPQRPTPVIAPPRVHVTPTPAPSETPIGAPAAPETAATSTPGNNIHFYERSVAGCGREDLMLMSPDEQMECRVRMAAAALSRDGGKIEVPDFSGIDQTKRSAWAAQQAADAERRDGTKAQAALKAIQDARGGTGANRAFDVNAGFNCKVALGTWATHCSASPPASNPAH